MRGKASAPAGVKAGLRLMAWERSLKYILGAMRLSQRMRMRIRLKTSEAEIRPREVEEEEAREREEAAANDVDEGTKSVLGN